MKHSQAEKYIRGALWAVQKSRSIGNEQAQNDPTLARVQRFLEPKVYDERFLLNPLLKIVEMLDNGETVKPMDFFNIMTVIDRRAPSVNACYILNSGESFPEPDARWLKGWEPE